MPDLVQKFHDLLFTLQARCRVGCAKMKIRKEIDLFPVGHLLFRCLVLISFKQKNVYLSRSMHTYNKCLFDISSSARPCCESDQRWHSAGISFFDQLQS